MCCHHLGNTIFDRGSKTGISFAPDHLDPSEPLLGGGDLRNRVDKRLLGIVARTIDENRH